jgi:protoporphyrinogen oxidase
MPDERTTTSGPPRVAVLGGGPAGLGAAWQLHVQRRGRATLVEQNAWFGGNAGSFEWEGQRLDFGSHRLHPACEPRILADVKALLGAELLDRPRHGRIRLMGRFVHFPLKPLDLLLRANPSFVLGMAGDTFAKVARLGRSRDGRVAASNGGGEKAASETFASFLRANLGRTMCERFYFPYARKIWGREPDELSGVQARRRVSASSVGKLVAKVLRSVPGFKKPGGGRFWYPRQAYGQLSESIARAAQSSGAELLLEHRVKRLEAPRGGEPWRIVVERVGRRDERVVEADVVWSTLPLTLLPKLVQPAAPAAVVEAASAVKYRAMLLVYLRLPVDQFTEFDAHYLPESDVRITRLSEPKNYSDRREPRGATTLCAELPCDASDAWFTASDAELGELVAEDLARSGLPLPAKPTAVKVMRLPQAYPIYLQGYEQPLARVQQWIDALPRTLTFGRQGLFAHDNTHHALAMAYAAVECLSSGGFDRTRWSEHLEVFSHHVVED